MLIAKTINYGTGQFTFSVWCLWCCYLHCMVDPHFFRDPINAEHCQELGTYFVTLLNETEQDC
jgi:hypothetical protein